MYMYSLVDSTRSSRPSTCCRAAGWWILHVCRSSTPVPTRYDGTLSLSLSREREATNFTNVVAMVVAATLLPTLIVLHVR